MKSKEVGADLDTTECLLLDMQYLEDEAEAEVCKLVQVKCDRSGNQTDIKLDQVKCDGSHVRF